MLLARLAERGYAPPPLHGAFASVDRARYLPPRYRAYAPLDVPLPAIESDVSLTTPSPRAAALLLLTLDVHPGTRVLLDVTDGGYLAALAAELVGPAGTVVLATGDTRVASAASKRLRAAGYGPERIRVVSAIPADADRFDRILLAREDARPADHRARLAEWGVVVARVARENRSDYVKIVRSGDEFGELGIGELSPVIHPLGPGIEEAWPLRRLFALEDALRRVWSGRPGTMEEAEFQRAVDATWRPLVRGEDPHRWVVARVLFHLGYTQLMSGDIEAAEDAFRASLSTLPSSEAFTFLGWTWSFSGRYEDAIDACRRAIDVDPSLGNPYNDIGAYLLELGRPEEAIPWLERAVGAERYEARAYPYANLARVHLMQGDPVSARFALEHALEMDPEYEPARLLLAHLDGDDEAGEEAGG